MYPRIKLQFDLSGHRFYLLEDLTLLTSFEVSSVDPERDDLSEVASGLSQFASSLSSHITMRIHLFRESSYESNYLTNSSREDEMSSLGFLSERILLSIETQIGGFWTLMDNLLKKPLKNTHESYARLLIENLDLERLRSLGLKIVPSIEHGIPQSSNHHLRVLPSGIELSPNLFGIVKFLGPTPQGLDLLTLYYLRQSIPPPYQLSFQMKRIPPAQAELLLRRKSSQSLAGQDKISLQKYYDSENLLEKIALERESLFSFELYLVLKRLSEESLRSDARVAIQALKPIGNFSFETFGALSCLKSLIPGATKHLSFKERCEVIPLYFPLVSADGEFFPHLGQPQSSNESKKNRSSRLILHRRDDTLGEVDLFNPRYDAYSTIIVGKTGSGKSVLTNLLTRSLFNDPDVMIIKVDVGGSHSKETESLGGLEFKLSLNQPSGINPFLCLQNGVDEASISVLANFLSVLMTEEGEFGLSKELRAELERALFLYSEKRSQAKLPSIDEFLELSQDFPRKMLLYRWARGGIYQKALISSQSDSDFNQFTTTTRNSLTDPPSRLRYYNFSEIHQASDPDFGQGGFSLVMAQFNLEMIKNKGKKLVFIADETPFFIRRCFSFFKFSTANVRKFGGLFISISQKSTDLVVNHDQGIIDNSPNRFLFSQDGDREEFQSRFQLSGQKMTALESLLRERGRFSEVLYQDNLGSKIFRIILSPNEYWRFSSTREDNQKIEGLMKLVPHLTRDEAIRTLSLGHEVNL